MASSPQSVEEIYRSRLDALTPAERVARSAAMFQWTKQQIARQILKQDDHLSEEQLKWRVAMRLYGDEPVMRKIIQAQIDHVSC